MPSRSHLVATAVLLLVIPCGCGRGPGAMRVGIDGNSPYFPSREIHFVEHGRRAAGVLVDVTEGGSNAFGVSWSTMLVPTTPGAAEGPVWSGRKPDRETILAIAALPEYRTEFYPLMYGDLVRERFNAQSIWLLGTDPFVLGLPAGEPRRSWRQYAVAETSTQPGQRRIPLNAYTVRCAVAGELGQPLARLLVFAPDFWSTHGRMQFADVKMTSVTPSRPLTVDEALDAIAAGDPTRLGEVETVGMETLYAEPKQRARNMREDRERLLRE